jgi:hypothetical protein
MRVQFASFLACLSSCLSQSGDVRCLHCPIFFLVKPLLQRRDSEFRWSNQAPEQPRMKRQYLGQGK